MSQQGYTSLLLTLDPEDDEKHVPADMLNRLEQGTACYLPEMTQALQSPPAEVGSIPFPPVLLAHGPVCAVAEKYASSHPLSALQLIDPPLSMKHAVQRYPGLFGSAPALPEFDFEAHFPVRVVWTQAELERHASEGIPWYDVHRIEHAREEEADESLDRYKWPSLKEGAQETVQWLETEVGV